MFRVAATSFMLALALLPGYVSAQASCLPGEKLVTSGCYTVGAMALDEEPITGNTQVCVAHSTGKRWGKVYAWASCL